MKLSRFLVQDRPAFGIVQDDTVSELTGDIFRPGRVTGSHRLSEVTLLPPCLPSKVVAVGLNYRDHAAELDFPVPEEPILFLKPATTVIGHGAPIRHPAMSARVDYEAELGIVIRDLTRNIRPADAADHILGYTCANDVTARDLQKKDGQWTRAKSFDTFCPVGPWVETELDPRDLAVEAFLNGQRKQASRTSNFIFDVPTLISFISRVMTLLPGDLVITGTPAGIGPMQPGDEIEVRIEGIGSLKNTINREKQQDADGRRNGG